MKIHEYQAKEIFKGAGIPVPPGKVVSTAKDAVKAAEEIGRPVVVKAQVLVGGRGKAGGVKLADNPADAGIKAGEILGMDIKGFKVDRVLITEAVDIKSEIYVGVIMDRKNQKPLIMASSEGGVEIEQVAREKPEAIHRMVVDPLFGALPFQCRSMASRLAGDIKVIRQISVIIEKLYKVFDECDASLAEINPLVVTPDDRVLAIDAKINIDDSSLFRHEAIEKLRDLTAEDPGEADARNAGLSFVKLRGNVGCMVNGAGLAMATMDLVKNYGGRPANFLDIGGSSNPEKVITALKLILQDSNVKAIFINIFGGITRCDDVAKGLVTAFKELDLQLPVVVRLTGTNEDKAREILSRVKLQSASTMDDGVKRAIELAGA